MLQKTPRGWPSVTACDLCVRMLCCEESLPTTLRWEHGSSDVKEHNLSKPYAFLQPHFCSEEVCDRTAGWTLSHFSFRRPSLHDLRMDLLVVANHVRVCVHHEFGSTNFKVSVPVSATARLQRIPEKNTTQFWTTWCCADFYSVSVKHEVLSSETEVRSGETVFHRIRPRDFHRWQRSRARGRTRSPVPVCAYLLFGNARNGRSSKSAVLRSQNCRKTTHGRSANRRGENPASAHKTLSQPNLPRRPTRTVNLWPSVDDRKWGHPPTTSGPSADDHGPSASRRPSASDHGPSASRRPRHLRNIVNSDWKRKQDVSSLAAQPSIVGGLGRQIFWMPEPTRFALCKIPSTHTFNSNGCPRKLKGTFKSIHFLADLVVR